MSGDGLCRARRPYAPCVECTLPLGHRGSHIAHGYSWMDWSGAPLSEPAAPNGTPAEFIPQPGTLPPKHISEFVTPPEIAAVPEPAPADDVEREIDRFEKVLANGYLGKNDTLYLIHHVRALLHREKRERFTPLTPTTSGVLPSERESHGAAIKEPSLPVPVLSAEEAEAIAEHLRIFVDSPNPKSTSRAIDRLAASHESLRQQVISLSEQIDASKK